MFAYAEKGQPLRYSDTSHYLFDLGPSGFPVKQLETHFAQFHC